MENYVEKIISFLNKECWTILVPCHKPNLARKFSALCCLEFKAGHCGTMIISGRLTIFEGQGSVSVKGYQSYCCIMNTGRM